MARSAWRWTGGVGASRKRLVVVAVNRSHRLRTSQPRDDQHYWTLAGCDEPAATAAAAAAAAVAAVGGGGSRVQQSSLFADTRRLITVCHSLSKRYIAAVCHTKRLPHSVVCLLATWDVQHYLSILIATNSQFFGRDHFNPLTADPVKALTLPYWSNSPFLIFDIRALWRSVLSARAPECQKLKTVG